MKITKTNRNEVYKGIDHVVLTDSTANIRREVNLLKPLSSSFLRRVQVNGDYKEAGHIRQDGKDLYLENFNGSIFVPYERATSLTANGSTVNGEHPLGKIIATDSTLSLNYPTTTGNLPPQYEPIVSLGSDITLSGLLTGLAHIPSLLLQNAGYSGWNLEYSAMFGLGSLLGIREKNKQTLATSLTAAALITFGPEMYDRLGGAETVGLEDVGKMFTYTVSGPVGRKLRKFYEDKIVGD